MQISDDLRARRRDRVRQIEWESQMPPGPAPSHHHHRRPSVPREERLISERGWDEERERIVEKEWYDRRIPQPPRPALPAPPPPPAPPPLPRSRVVEKEKVVIVRD